MPKKAASADKPASLSLDKAQLAAITSAICPACGLRYARQSQLTEHALWCSWCGMTWKAGSEVESPVVIWRPIEGEQLKCKLTDGKGNDIPITRYRPVRHRRRKV